jgi:hypothetical protein
LRKDLHFPAAVFFPLHALQLAGALSGIAEALCGELLVGEGIANLKDSNRLPDPSTLRRWSSGLDLSQVALSFARQAIAHIAPWGGAR